MFYTWLSYKRNGLPSWSPIWQPLPSTIHSTRQTSIENCWKAKPIHRKVYRRSLSCHTIHQKPQWTLQTYPSKIQGRVFFKGTNNIKSLLLHPKDPNPDVQKTKIIYNWKCTSHNCTAEYIGKSNRSLKERVPDHKNQTTSAIRNHHISIKHPKAEFKSFTIIDTGSNTLHCQAKKQFTLI